VYMNKLQLLPVCVLLILTICILHITQIYAQSQSTTNLKTESANEKNALSVSASLTVEVRNETLVAKTNLLRTAVSGFLAAGPGIFKSTDSGEPVIKTKIANKINNSTQNVEGTDASYAILGVEINKALRTVISSSTQPNQTAIVKIETSSTCKPSGPTTITCGNTVTLS
jgi:hypothetical protein